MRPTELLVYAIVTLALVLLVIYLFQNIYTPNTVADEIAISVNVAMLPNSLGKTIEVHSPPVKNGLKISKETIVTKGLFDATKVSYAFECTDPSKCCPMNESCSKSIEWNYTSVNFKNAEQLRLFSRCYEKDGLPVCRTYVGKKPAQAEISGIEKTQDNSKVYTIVKLKNSGDLTLIEGVFSVKLFKKVNKEWLDTGNTYPEQTVETIEPGKEYTVLQEINVTTQGEYKLVFKFEALNAGFDENDINFSGTENSGCQVDESIVEIQRLADSNGYREMKHCTGCNYSYECLGAWMENDSSTQFFEYNKDATYCKKTNYYWECGQTTPTSKTNCLEVVGWGGHYSANPCEAGYKEINVPGVTQGHCCEKIEIPNPCNTTPSAPESPDCITWLPQNPTYVCPVDPSISYYDKKCNVNQWDVVNSP